MNEPKTVLTEAFRDTEVRCNWTPEGHADHALAALKADGYAVVRSDDILTAISPKPMTGERHREITAAQDRLAAEVSR